MNNNSQEEYFPLKPDENDVSFLKIIGGNPSLSHRVINDREKLKFVVGVLKKEGLKIVYTSGVYDMVHDGHVDYLEKAKQLGDILIVGIDDDEYTRLRKPNEKNRPIDTLSVRLKVLAHNRSVNILVPRTVSEHPDQLIKDILPDVAVFSYSTDKNPELFEKKIRDNVTKYVGQLIFLEAQSTNSTTAKIRKIAGNGSHELATHLQEHLKLSPEDMKKLKKEIDHFFNLKNGGS